MADSQAEGTGGTATEEVDELDTPATKRDVIDAIEGRLGEFEQPMSYEEARAAARSGMLWAMAIIISILAAAFGVYNLVADSDLLSLEQKRQNKKQYNLLLVNDPGRGLKGVFYLPPGPYHDDGTSSGEHGIYYVQPEEQTDDAQAMALHLITRAFKYWREEITSSKDVRQMVGTPQLIYEDGVPVAAFVYYRHVQKNNEGEKG